MKMKNFYFCLIYSLIPVFICGFDPALPDRQYNFIIQNLTLNNALNTTFLQWDIPPDFHPNVSKSIICVQNIHYEEDRHTFNVSGISTNASISGLRVNMIYTVQIYTLVDKVLNKATTKYLFSPGNSGLYAEDSKEIGLCLCDPVGSLNTTKGDINGPRCKLGSWECKCRDNVSTTGKLCNICVDGFYRTGGTGVCTACPGCKPPNSNGQCVWDAPTQKVRCRSCNTGYFGTHCDQCSSHFYRKRSSNHTTTDTINFNLHSLEPVDDSPGNIKFGYKPLSGRRRSGLIGEGHLLPGAISSDSFICVPCRCVDPAIICHNLTGQCVPCPNGTTGKRCDRCLPNLYGTPPNCTLFNFNSSASFSISESKTGITLIVVGCSVFVILLAVGLFSFFRWCHTESLVHGSNVATMVERKTGISCKRKKFSSPQRDNADLFHRLTSNDMRHSGMNGDSETAAILLNEHPNADPANPVLLGRLQFHRPRDPAYPPAVAMVTMSSDKDDNRDSGTSSRRHTLNEEDEPVYQPTTTYA